MGEWGNETCEPAGGMGAEGEDSGVGDGLVRYAVGYREELNLTTPFTPTEPQPEPDPNLAETARHEGSGVLSVGRFRRSRSRGLRYTQKWSQP